MYKLLVLDNDRFCGQCIQKIISIQKLEYVYCGQAFDKDNCLALVAETLPDVVLIDRLFCDDAEFFSRLAVLDNERLGLKKKPLLVEMDLSAGQMNPPAHAMITHKLQKPFTPSKVAKLLTDLAVHMNEQMQNGSVTEAAKQKVDWAIDYIKTHLGQDIGLENISSLVHYSPSHFSRVFKSIVGCPYSQYVNNLRIDTARILLSQTNRSIQAIAQDVGFERINTFGKLFKEKTGMSPRTYRQKQQSANIK